MKLLSKRAAKFFLILHVLLFCSIRIQSLPLGLAPKDLLYYLSKVNVLRNQVGND